MVGLGDDLRVQGGDLVREVRGVVGLGGDLRLQGGDLVRLDIHLVFPLINFALPVQLHDVGNPTACPSLPPEVTGIARGVHRGRILGVPGHAHVLVQVPGHAQENNTRQTGNHHDRPDPSGRLRYSSARRAVDERRALIIRRRGDVRCLDVHRDVSKRAPGRAVSLCRPIAFTHFRLQKKNCLCEKAKRRRPAHEDARAIDGLALRGAKREHETQRH